MKYQLTSLSWLHWAILLLSFSSLQAQWKYIGSPETGHAIHYDDGSDGIYMLATAGLFFSADNGNSWTNIPLPEYLTTANQVFEEKGSLYLFTNSLLLDPTIVPAGYRSDDLGLTWKNIYPFNPLITISVTPALKGDTLVFVDGGILAVSVDRGDSYTMVVNGTFNPDEIFFHHETLLAVSFNELYASDNLGFLWEERYVSPDSLFGLSISSVGNKLYKHEQYFNFPTLEAYISMSLDDGLTWQLQSTSDFTNNSYSTFFGDDQHLFLTDRYSSSDLYYSINDGITWQNIASGENFSGYFFFNDLLFGIKYPDHADGVWISHDFGQTFESYTTGFYAADCEKITHSNDKLWVNANTKVFENVNGSQWDELEYFENITTGNGTHFMAYANNILKRSSDGGQLWYTVPSTLFDKPNYNSFATIHACGNLFFVYVQNEYWYSRDFGLTWQVVDFLNGETLSAYSFDDPAYVLSGDRGTVIQSMDGLTWQDISFDIWAPGVASISMLHRQDDYTFARVGIGNVRLTPGSTNWEEYEITVANPDIFSQPAEINAMTHLGNVVLGTIYGHGVFISLNKGENWQPFNLGLTDFQTTDIDIFKDQIYVAVRGGMWSRPLTDLNLFHFSGTVFNDENENGIQEISESGLGNIILRKHVENIFTTSSNDGQFDIYSQINLTDTISAVALSPYGTITTPPLYTSQPDSNFSIGIHFIPNIYDAAIYITNNTPFRPGFESTITLTYKNNGTAATDLEIKLALPSELEYLSSSPEATFIADTLTWLIQDVPALTGGNISIDVKTDASVPLGTPILLYAFTDVTNDGDANHQDNEAYLTAVVVGSYDPNDKAVFPSGNITPAMIADTQRLEYTIRFQNTGNFPATFVMILDTLSTHLDLTSLEILSASHSYTWKLLPQNVLDVFFDNINLPDSTNDERGSHGFVKFAINAKPTLRLADKIENKAYIYFDFNVPVITNTVGSTVGFETSIKEPGKKLALTASPNPTKDFIMVTISERVTDGEVVLSLYDTKGALVKTKTSASPENIQLDIRDIPSGVYYLNARVGHDQGSIRILKN